MRWLRPAALLGGAGVIGAAVGVFSAVAPMPGKLGAGEIISGCRVIDGDTLRCGSERIRLLAIDAPELPGHCRPGRLCAPGDPVASSESLDEGLVGRLAIERVGQDRYGRTLALVSGEAGDLSCWQLKRGHAIYKADWDNGGRVANTCPGLVR